MRTVEPQIAAHRWLTTNPENSGIRITNLRLRILDGNQKVAYFLYIVYYSICVLFQQWFTLLNEAS